MSVSTFNALKITLKDIYLKVQYYVISPTFIKWVKSCHSVWRKFPHVPEIIGVWVLETAASGISQAVYLSWHAQNQNAESPQLRQLVCDFKVSGQLKRFMEEYIKSS